MKLFYLLFCVIGVIAEGDSQALTSKSSVCDSDFAIICPTEKSHRGKWKCLRDHLDQVSAGCAAHMKEWQAKQDSCKEAATTFCPDEESRCAIRRCLISHVDELTGTCADYIREKMVEYAKEVSPTACDNDATTLCSNATGFSTTLVCMKQNFENLSHECRRLFWKLKKSHEEKYPKDHEKDDSHHEKGEYYHRRHYGREKKSKKEENLSEKHTEKHSKKHEKHSKKHEKQTEKRTRKIEKCTRKLKKACDQDLTTYCSTVTGLRDIKYCLMNKFTSISKNCQEYLINPKYRKEPKTGEKETAVIYESIDDSAAEISADSSSGSEPSSGSEEL